MKAPTRDELIKILEAYAGEYAMSYDASMHLNYLIDDLKSESAEENEALLKRSGHGNG